MRQFNIYHPINGDMNHDCLIDTFMYELIATIECDSIHNAFKLGQNDFNDEYAKLHHRSTSVGDIIVDVDEDLHYLIEPIGFRLITSSVTHYIDWGQIELH